MAVWLLRVTDYINFKRCKAGQIMGHLCCFSLIWVFFSYSFNYFFIIVVLFNSCLGPKSSWMVKLPRVLSPVASWFIWVMYMCFLFLQLVFVWHLDCNSHIPVWLPRVPGRINFQWFQSLSHYGVLGSVCFSVLWVCWFLFH